MFLASLRNDERGFPFSHRPSPRCGKNELAMGESCRQHSIVRGCCRNYCAAERGEGGRLEIFCNLPTLLAFYPALSGHQYISLRRLRLAENKPIEIYNLNKLGLQPQELIDSQSPVKVVKVRQPKPRTKRTAIASQQLSGEELMWQMISGASGKKDDENLLRGEPEKLAERILNFLTEKGIYHPSKGSHKESNKGDSEKK